MYSSCTQYVKEDTNKQKRNHETTNIFIQGQTHEKKKSNHSDPPARPCCLEENKHTRE